MSKLFGKSFWFCLACLSNLLLLKNTVFAAETTAAQVPIPDAQEPIALSETQHQLAAETDAPSQAVSVPAPPETVHSDATADTPESQLTATSNPPGPPVIASELKQSETPATKPEKNPLTPAKTAAQSPDATSMNQVTSVSQLSDVRPTDWAFQALQSLVERYGCIAGYPDGTYRGNRALTRYEFAAGLNACLDQVTKLIGSLPANIVTQEDLAVLQRLQEEFAAELATLRGRVDALEARTSELEANQFSTTTTLNGETIFAVSDTFGKGAVGDDKTTANLGYRVRLNFDTSFTGTDRLRTRLQARNNARYDRPTGTPMTRTNFDGDGGSEITLDKLSYQFLIGSRTNVEIGAKGLTSDDVAPLINPYFDSAAQGAVSRFGAFNPAIYNTPGETGIAINHQLSDRLNLTLTYLTNTAADSTEGNGLFNGSYGAIAQLTYSPSSELDLALSYVRSYSRKNDVDLSLGTGSNNANQPFNQNATRGNHFGLQASWRPSSRFALSGWAGYVDAQQLSGGDAKAQIWNGGVTFAFPDLFSEGNVGGLIVGVPPKTTRNDIKENKDNATSLHVEALYLIQVSDFISITPGVYVITNTDHNKDNGTTWVGVLRTSFTF
ncbi:iron uptake porin [Microcoleus sp. OTE_8_concoct_300]|uniref:iron uptake porin n=1 Tax=Microcoleus sp. OTE_8_concoct_300 TaxID=2964710 RepID=UPI00403F6C0A